jgi:hypothetical protein
VCYKTAARLYRQRDPQLLTGLHQHLVRLVQLNHHHHQQQQLQVSAPQLWS